MPLRWYDVEPDPNDGKWPVDGGFGAAHRPFPTVNKDELGKNFLLAGQLIFPYTAILSQEFPLVNTHWKAKMGIFFRSPKEEFGHVPLQA